VPLFNQKTDQEKQEERLAQEQERRAQAEREAQAKYLASPVGKAEAAYNAGQMFFQLTTNISQIDGRSSDWNYSQSTLTKRFNATDTLGQIEEMGWHLEHVGYVFVETGEIARAKALSSGSVTRTQGYVEGIYLFRRRS
jgi:multidrug efflux pump subunit AcrA (membrane-fusion protein)